MAVIKLVDFTKFPLGRYEGDSSSSGEVFRKNWLLPALNKNDENIVVYLDGAKVAIGSSFLEEAFGGLIRHENFTLNELNSRLSIDTTNDMYKVLISKYLNTAEEVRLKNKR
ncbi:STAS-like domain-containing protein [Providencia sp. PROV160]|uniref:STAS-like domain-containing protein n=1 Tax=Providencia sp. PROV160 TaxID=2949869 RepID=UPI002349DAF6|nr:STAS-like domain-containing protein [Providencia sp. PROV160]